MKFVRSGSDDFKNAHALVIVSGVHTGMRELADFVPHVLEFYANIEHDLINACFVR